MQFLTRLAILITTLVLAACGGGGGGDGTGGLNPAKPETPPGPSALQLNMTAVTLQPSATAEVAVFGGTPPYTVTSSEQTVAQATVVSAPARILITGGLVASGATADLVLTDAAGQTATVKVTIQYPALAVAPSALSISAGDTASFVVNGGVPPYALFATNPGSVSLSPTTLHARGATAAITALGATSQPASIVLTDAVGSSVSVTVTVGAATSLLQSLAVTPAVGTGSSVAAGGLAVVTLDAAESMAGRQIRFERRSGAWQFEAGPGVSLDGSTATVTIDAAGQALTRLQANADALTQSAVVRAVDVLEPARFLDSVFTITGALLGVTPDTFIAQNSTAPCGGQTAAFQVYGGQPPYTVASTRPVSAQVLTPNVSSSGGTFLVLAGNQCDGTSGPTNLYVRDAVGASTVVKFYNLGGAPTSALTVSPETMSLVTGQTAAFSLQNGTLPFTVASSNTAVASVSAVAGSPTAYHVHANAPGTALVTITDATSQSVSVAVTVAASSTLKVTPASVSARISAGSAMFVASGGQAPYSALSSVPAVATLTQTAPGQFTATFGGTLGMTDIVVQDATGQVVSATLTVTNN